MTLHNGFCWVCSLRSIIIDIHQFNEMRVKASGATRAASAVSIAEELSRCSPNMVLGTQQDPSEFLIILLNMVIECLSSTLSNSFTQYQSSVIHSFIGINMKSFIRCEICSTSHQNETYESLWSVPVGSHSSVCAALAAFCADEQLFGVNAFNCSNCQRRVKACRKMKLANIAPIMFIHLKRFVYDNRRRMTIKLKHFVKLQEAIDLTPYVDQDDVQQRNKNYEDHRSIYSLLGVLVHLGDAAETGHVFAYILAPDNEWYKADDEIVTRVSLDVVLNDRNAYVLCYGRTTKTRCIRWTPEQSRHGAKPSWFSSTPRRFDDESDSTDSDCSPVRVAIDHRI